MLNKAPFAGAFLLPVTQPPNNLADSYNWLRIYRLKLHKYRFYSFYCGVMLVAKAVV
jgi:hypothetical protein